ARLEVLGHGEDAVGEYVRVEVERDLVALPEGRVVQLPAARVHRLGRRRQLADDLLIELLAEGPGSRIVLLRRGGVELGPERLVADALGVAHEMLRVGDELVELAILAGVCIIEPGPGLDHTPRRNRQY